jgi:hypothetical protein
MTEPRRPTPPYYLGRPFPVDRRRVPELEGQGYRVVDELASDWRGEMLVMMDRRDG